MKTVLVFDDEILTGLRLRRELETRVVEPKTDFGLTLQYGMKVLDCTGKEEKIFIRYMWHKKKRIQKKWDKRYNDRFRIVRSNPFMCGISA